MILSEAKQDLYTGPRAPTSYQRPSIQKCSSLKHSWNLSKFCGISTGSMPKVVEHGFFGASGLPGQGLAG